MKAPKFKVGERVKVYPNLTLSWVSDGEDGLVRDRRFFSLADRSYEYRVSTNMNSGGAWFWESELKKFRSGRRYKRNSRSYVSR